MDHIKFTGMDLGPHVSNADDTPINHSAVISADMSSGFQTCLKIWLECRLGVPVHCLQSNGVIIHMTSRTSATSIRLFWQGC